VLPEGRCCRKRAAGNVLQEEEGGALQFHLLSFEGPDPYARIGGLASRVVGLARALAALGFETHLWFIGDPGLPGHERVGAGLVLHRWCQWISAHHPEGAYDGEEGKASDFARSLPPFLFEHYLRRELESGRGAIVVAEEWQTVDAVLHLDWLLRCAGLRDRLALQWNANNTFGFERIDFAELARAASLTTVSRYMRRLMRGYAADPLVIPNGLGADAYPAVAETELQQFAECVRGRMVLTKLARWDPAKRWLGALDAVAELGRRGERPLLIARGGAGVHRAQVFERARALGLRVRQRSMRTPSSQLLLELIARTRGVDVLVLTSHLEPTQRRLLFRASDAVLANSAHEPFGLVGLEAMAVGGLACTGGTGEDYARDGHNAVVIRADDPRVSALALALLRRDPVRAASLRRAGEKTARRYAWKRIALWRLFPSLAEDPYVLPASVRAHMRAQWGSSHPEDAE